MNGPADLLIVSGRVFQAYRPGDLGPYGSDLGPRPIGAPTSLAVVGERIAWVGGAEAALRDWRGPRTEVFEANGGLVTAGFDDAHVHLIGGAQALERADLFGLETVERVADAIRRHAADEPHAPWVLGRGWLYVAFPGGLPTRATLDAAVPDRPAFMVSYDGHTGWANSAALRLAGIDRDTPDPPGGIVVRDPTGEPTGALKETAQRLVERHVPPPGEAETLDAMRRAIGAMQATGITAIQDALVEPAELPLWRTLRDDGSLGVRARLALPMRPGASLEGWRQTLDEYDALVGDLRGGPWLDAGVLKAFGDGVVEARTAAMLEPYVDDTSTGYPAWEAEELGAFVAEADRRGWQIETHTTGDAAIRMTLDAYERAAAANGPRDRRHRLEHIETVTRADIPRFAHLGVVASMQPYHADPSPNQVDVWAGAVGAERAGQAWSWASIRHHGAVVALGSDWPVVPFDPFIALNAAVNRQTIDGQPPGGWLPSEKLSLPEALSAYGHGSAYAAFAEGRRGTVRPGADADLVVLDRDILAGGPASIIGTSAVLTVVGGRVVHRAEVRP